MSRFLESQSPRAAQDYKTRRRRDEAHTRETRKPQASPHPPTMSAAAPDDVAPWLDVVQRAGEVLYIPPDWQHATLSLADSVAAAVEFV